MLASRIACCLALTTLILIAMAGVAAADVCPIFCPTPTINYQTCQQHGVAVNLGGATLSIFNATPPGPFPLPDLNWISDSVNGTSFFADDVFFGVPTVVMQGGTITIRSMSQHRSPVVISFYEAQGPLGAPLSALVLNSYQSISLPAASMPCAVKYHISSPQTGTQMGMIVTVESLDDIIQLMVANAEGTAAQLCTNPKASFMIIDALTGDYSGLTTIDVGQSVQWFNGLDVAITLMFSSGLDVAIGPHDSSGPVLFETEGNFTYTVPGHNGMGILQVQGNGVTVPGVSWGALKEGYGE